MYKITIEKTTVETKTAGKEWECVGKDENGKPIYDYTPEIEKKKDITRTVYTQTIDELNLVAVINAVNKIV